MFAESDLIPISALQHYVYCSRQCALIHVEQVWSDSWDTAQGVILHDRAHRGETETRKNLRTTTAVPVRSLQYGLVGITDMVEFHAGVPYPIEYKKGRTKSHDADRVQLCAQALCLEEMMHLTISEGALFYHAANRRETVVLDDALRTFTVNTARSVRNMLEEYHLPSPVYSQRLCGRCSLMDRCQPRVRHNVSRWLCEMLE